MTTTTTTTNKEIIAKVNRGFEAGDQDAILAHIADTIRWDVPGAFTAVGKEQFRKNITNVAFQGTPNITVTRTIAEDDYVAAEGTVQSKSKSGELFEASFFNIYQLADGKIKEMRSYIIPKNTRTNNDVLD